MGIIMEKDVVLNSITNELALIFSESLVDWETNPQDTFFTCWKRALDNYTVLVSIKDREQINMPDDYAEIVLKKNASIFADFVIAQAFTYSYEFINKSFADLEGTNKQAYEKIKKQILRENISDEKILRVIRNALAHNNDTGITRWDYNVLYHTFSFNFNNNNQAVVLDKRQLAKLIEIAGNHFMQWHTKKYIVEPDFWLFFPFSSKSSDELLKLVDRKNGKVIQADEHQKEVLDEIVDEIRFAGFRPNFDLNLFYPFKSNACNNSAKMGALSILMKDLMDFKDCNFDDFSKKYRAKNYTVLDDYDSTTNIVSLFMTSLLFQLCSNTPNAVLNECIKGVKDDIKMSSVRNAIVHGTFFYDKDVGFHFYDGKEKDESKLKYVGYLNFLDIVNLKENISKYKFATDENVKVSLGNYYHPEPYKVDDEKIK